MDIPSRSNAAVLFLDLQDEIVTHSRTAKPKLLRQTAGGLAQLAALHRLPTFLSLVPQGGAFMDAVLGPLGNPEPRPRTQTTAFADAGLVEALRASGRRVLVLAGVASEIVVQRTALDALAAGYQVFVAVDACGGVGERTEDAAWRRVSGAGGATTSVVTFAAELAGDFGTELGGATLKLMYDLLAYEG